MFFKISLYILFCSLLFSLITVSWNSFLLVYIHVLISFQLLSNFSIQWIFHNLYYYYIKLFYALNCWNVLFWHIEMKHSLSESIIKFLLQDSKKKYFKFNCIWSSLEILYFSQVNDSSWTCLGESGINKSCLIQDSFLWFFLFKSYSCMNSCVFHSQIDCSFNRLKNNSENISHLAKQSFLMQTCQTGYNT